MLYVLGANGTGKSSLLQRFTKQNAENTRKISAHRQTWMNTDALDMTPSNKLDLEKSIRNRDQRPDSRYRDHHAAQRAGLTIYELIDAENVRARSIAAAVDAKDMEEVTKAAGVEAPIALVNELLLQSNIPIAISIQRNERLVASKDGGAEYSASQLSDGERNALLIAGSVLTAPRETLFIIDEPERHLHRSIIVPLLTQLFEHRSDCGFVISTHDHDLPLQTPNAETLLLRNCHFDGENVLYWEADELIADSPIDDNLKRDLLGSRRKIIFVEGTERSLDKPLYSLIFPMVSVIAKGTANNVVQSVVGSRAGEGFHWLNAFGIVDGDGYDADQITAKLEQGIYTLPYYSVEAIYFHPFIIQCIAERQVKVSGRDAKDMFNNALAAGIAAISDHTARLSQKVAKKTVRKLIMEQIPNDDDILSGQQIEIENDAVAIVARRKAELDEAVRASDWESILTKSPVRESSALTDITAALGFRKVEDYEQAVRHLMKEDEDALLFTRGLFGDLFDQLQA